MEKPMRTQVPKTDSIRELAEFWDTHDFIDFQDQFEEVTEPLFRRKTVIQVEFPPQEAQAVGEIADSTGVKAEDLVRQWILEKVTAS
jgi:hypothetical protein